MLKCIYLAVISEVVSWAENMFTTRCTRLRALSYWLPHANKPLLTIKGLSPCSLFTYVVQCVYVRVVNWVMLAILIRLRIKWLSLCILNSIKSLQFPLWLWFYDWEYIWVHEMCGKRAEKSLVLKNIEFIDLKNYLCYRYWVFVIYLSIFNPYFVINL